MSFCNLNYFENLIESEFKFPFKGGCWDIYTHTHRKLYIYIYVRVGHDWPHMSMHTSIYVCIHTHIHTYIHTYTCVYTHTYIHTYTHIHIHIYVCVYTQTCFHVCSCMLSHVRLCDLMDCSVPGSSIHGIFQARILEWVAIFYSNIYVHIYTYKRYLYGHHTVYLLLWII